MAESDVARGPVTQTRTRIPPTSPPSSPPPPSPPCLRIVLANAHTLPQPSVDGVGPRYCPSIFKKVRGKGVGRGGEGGGGRRRRVFMFSLVGDYQVAVVCLCVSPILEPCSPQARSRPSAPPNTSLRRRLVVFLAAGRQEKTDRTVAS